VYLLAEQALHNLVQIDMQVRQAANMDSLTLFTSTTGEQCQADNEDNEPLHKAEANADSTEGEDEQGDFTKDPDHRMCGSIYKSALTEHFSPAGKDHASLDLCLSELYQAAHLPGDAGDQWRVIKTLIHTYLNSPKCTASERNGPTVFAIICALFCCADVDPVAQSLPSSLEFLPLSQLTSFQNAMQSRWLSDTELSMAMALPNRPEGLVSTVYCCEVEVVHLTRAFNRVVVILAAFLTKIPTCVGAPFILASATISKHSCWLQTSSTTNDKPQNVVLVRVLLM
jgi:hypothetical protein